MKVEAVDVSGMVKRLEGQLEEAARVAPDEARKVLQKGLLNIKNDWRKRWTGFSHAPALPNAITYDTAAVVGDRVSGEVGPDKDRRQGALGNLFEYGSVKNAPIPGGAPALEREAPRFERALEDLITRVAEGR